ncbi:hypothetical protein ERJ75_001172000 [Trypanosoma vivax]|nr:hypothetical protein ERJ75_001172000 [Trypanosoma vivax]
MACDECRHPTCAHSLAKNYVADCIDERCDGCMAFVPRSSGKWKICCNHCTMMILLPPTAQRVYVSSEECKECGAMMMDLQFPEGQSPLANRKDRVVACVFCDPTISSSVSEVRGRMGNFSRRGGGGRGARTRTRAWEGWEGQKWMRSGTAGSCLFRCSTTGPRLFYVCVFVTM